MSTELELVYTWSNVDTDLHEKQDTASLQCTLELSNDDMDAQTFFYDYDRIPMPLQGYHTLCWDPSRRDNTFLLGTYDGKWVSLDEQDYSIAYVQHAQLGNDMDGLPLPYVPLTHVLNDSLQQHLHEYIHAVAMNHVHFSSPHTFSMRSIAYGMPSGEVQVWNVAREVPQPTIVIPNEEETTPVTAVAWSQMFHNGDNNTMPEDFNSFLAVGRSSGRVFLYEFNWNAMEYRILGSVLPPVNTDAIHSLQWIHGMNENDHLFLFTGSSQHLRMYNVDQFRRNIPPVQVWDLSAPVCSIACTPHHSYALAGTQNGQLHLCNTTSGSVTAWQPALTAKVQNLAMNTVVWNHTGEYFAWGCQESTFGVSRFNSTTGERTDVSNVTLALFGALQPIRSVQFYGNTDRLAILQEKGMTLTLFSIQAEQLRCQQPSSGIETMRFIPLQLYTSVLQGDERIDIPILKRRSRINHNFIGDIVEMLTHYTFMEPSSKRKRTPWYLDVNAWKQLLSTSVKSNDVQRFTLPALSDTENTSVASNKKNKKPKLTLLFCKLKF